MRAAMRLGLLHPHRRGAGGFGRRKTVGAGTVPLARDLVAAESYLRLVRLDQIYYVLHRPGGPRRLRCWWIKYNVQ